MVNVYVNNLTLKHLKHMRKKRINQLKSVKAKELKRGCKKDVLENDFKNVNY